MTSVAWWLFVMVSCGIIGIVIASARKCISPVWAFLIGFLGGIIGLIYLAVKAPEGDTDQENLIDCPKCHIVFSGTTRFCTQCGHQFFRREKKQQLLNPTELVQECPTCYFISPYGEKFCPQCGYDFSIDNHTSRHFENPRFYQPNSYNFRPTGDPSLPIPATYQNNSCPYCAEPIPLHVSICPFCNMSLPIKTYGNEEN